MTDQRPQYGEYATPEEQRRLAGLPPVDMVPVQTPATTLTPDESVSAESVPVRTRPWDRIVTIGLLAYGVVNVFMTAMAYMDLPTVMNESMQILGIEGEFTNFAQARTWGTIATAVLVIGWVITAALSLRRLRTGKRTWWVPLVGAVVTTVIVSLCLTVPMMGDPAFIAYIESMTGS